MNLINELRMLAEDLHVNGYNRYSAAMSKAADELASLERYRTAFNEWIDKTEWVQADTSLPAKYLGMHRADVIKDMISELFDRLEAAEQDAFEQARLNCMGAERELALMAKLEAAEKERNAAKAAAENIALKLDYLRSKLETAENAHNEWLRANAPGGWVDALRVENEALRAEVIHIKEVEFPRKAQAVADGWRGKCERLEAKIAEMEQQKPVAWRWELKAGQYTYIDKPEHAGKKARIVPLYALPGAQTQGEEK